MTTQFKQDKLAVENAAQDAQNVAVYKGWLAQHPSVADVIANEKMFREYMDFTDELTEADFDFAYGNLGDKVLATQRVPTLEEVKAELVDKICERLTSSDGSGRSDANVKLFRTKAKFMSLPEVTAKLEELTRKVSITAMPHAERKQILVNARQYQDQYPAYPKMVVRPGTVKAIPRDRKYLLSLDVYDLKKERRLYGNAAIDARLNGK